MLSTQEEKQAIDYPKLEALARWVELEDYVNSWYADADLEALRIVLSATVAHHYLNQPPAWMFVIGAPSTGKTEIAIHSLDLNPGVRHMGTITRNTLLSGLSDHYSDTGKKESKKSASLLKRLGNPILVFSDFSTFLHLRPDDRVQISSDLRTCYDGAMQKDVGTGKEITWSGKMTVIAAATPAMERNWQLLGDLGERFLTVRWKRPGDEAAPLAALKQIGYEKEIRERKAELTAAFVDRPSLPSALPELSEDQAKQCQVLARLLCWARTMVHRARDTARTITDIPEPESPSRAAKVLAVIVKQHATLFRREVSEEDMMLVNRIAWDSIPQVRRRIIQHLMKHNAQHRTDLVRDLDMPLSTIRYHHDSLTALKITTPLDDYEAFELTEPFRALLGLPDPSNPILEYP